MQPCPPHSLFSTGRTVRILRTQIEAATGSPFAHPFRSGATAAVWGHGAADALGRSVLRVAPGPTSSPYDTPANGLASLRLTLDGVPYGGVPADAALADRLRVLRLHGRNRFPDGIDGDAVPDGTALILLDGSATPARNRAFVAGVLAGNPGTAFVAAGPEGGLGIRPTPHLRVLRDPIDPWAACAAAARVFVADAASACTARLSGAEVIETGPPTGIEDAYGAGLHWFDPWTRMPIAREECLEKVAWLRARFRDNDRPTVLVGISRWKRPGLEAFTTGPYGPPIHAMGAEEAVRRAPPDARVLAWATRMPEHLETLCAEAGLPLSRETTTTLPLIQNHRTISAS